MKKEEVLLVVGRVAARVNVRNVAIPEGASSQEKGVAGLCIVCTQERKVKHLTK